jgi:ATP-dependent protease ClpP protease subunit
MPFKLVTHNVGNVDSIGNVVFLAGEERYACPSATFMFHGVHSGPMEGERPNVNTIQEKLDGLLNDQNRICTVIVSRTKITARELDRLFRQGQTKDAGFALAKGIIDEIREVKISPGVPFLTIIFRPALPN